MTRNPSFDDEPPESDAEWLKPFVLGVNDAAEEPWVDPAIWEWSPEWGMWREKMQDGEP